MQITAIQPTDAGALLRGGIPFAIPGRRIRLFNMSANEVRLHLTHVNASTGASNAAIINPLTGALDQFRGQPTALYLSVTGSGNVSKWVDLECIHPCFWEVSGTATPTYASVL